MDPADDDEETPTSRSSSSLPDDPRLREAIGEETRHLRLCLPLFACLLSCSRAIGCILDDLYIYVHLVFFRLAEQMPTADAETVTSESTAVIQQDSTMFEKLDLEVDEDVVDEDICSIGNMTHEEEEADLERGIHSILKNHPIMKKLNKGIHPVVLALHVLLEEEEEEEVVQEEDMAKGLAELDEYLSRHTYHTIEEATASFTGVIGHGGSGVVYKGVLDDERAVAVKVLKNVSRMWGCCSQGKHRILVSEYIENGSLAHKLFGRDGFDDDVLDWNQRFRIALCVAKGLAYLHSECSEWIVPCDMKPENILLDKDLEPKITDFGLSKLLNRDGSDAILTRIRGTRGYMAPEWVTNLPVIEKVDVYSYGVILLELVKGIWISEWVIHGIKVCEMDIRIVVRVTREKMESNEEKSIEDLVDYRLNGDFNHVQVKLMLEIALSCLEEDRSKRPNMNSVVQALISFEG
ncbi:hypothetical protein OsJ_35115 [Oryza sativa Japonica Group]|uniref:Protein kinase domain-containing protein n=2 Tax=Oryza sativa subsp. japonica TaxID=39947 RepID=B9GBQ1_ORYSJ|nr:hypothetical protein OsJ_35115 [Oryza sativa Japonica Group]